MFDIEEHLENLREQNRCFSIPFQIEEVIVENLGPIENFEGMFENLNIIAGQNESGKTTLIRSIAYACGKNAFEVEKILRREEKKGKITVKTTPREKMSVELRRKKDGIEKEEGAKCLLLDAPADRLDKNNFVEFLKRLSDLDSQVILTTARPLDDIEEDFINKIHLSK